GEVLTEYRQQSRRKSAAPADLVVGSQDSAFVGFSAPSAPFGASRQHVACSHTMQHAGHVRPFGPTHYPQQAK
ncbi:hypothetical protein PINS_up015272, partial [Pythium insidiosum]